MTYNTHSRGGSRNSSREASGPEFFKGGGGLGSTSAGIVIH